METIKPIYDKNTLVDKYNNLHKGEYQLDDAVMKSIKGYLLSGYHSNKFMNANGFIKCVLVDTNKLISPQHFRKYIQLIREYKFTYRNQTLEDRVVIASPKGYKLTSDQDEIRKYLKQLDGRRHSLMKQIVVMELTQTNQMIMEAQDEKGMDGY